MKYVLKNGNVAFAKEILNVDILIENEKIIEIGKNLDTQTIIDCKNKLITPSFVDLHVHTRTPGFEYKEDIKSLNRSAIMGGFTDVIAMPNLNPAPNDIETLTKIQTLINNQSQINIIQSATITNNRQNQELNDFTSLKNYTNFISDDGSGVENNSLMQQGLKAAKKLDLTMLIHPEYLDLVNGGCVSICQFAKDHNLKEMDPIAEELMIGRDLILNSKLNAKLHFCHVSTKKGVQLIEKLKTSNTTFEIAPHHLVLTTDDLQNHGNFKMNPPLRSKADVDYLVDYLATKKDTIIATDHAPHAKYEKNTTLDKSLFGIIGLESCFPLLYTKLVLTKKVPLINLINSLTVNPAKVLGINKEIKTGANANLCILDLQTSKKLTELEIGSKSQNTPFLGEMLQGYVETLIYKGKKIYEVNNEI